MDKRIIIELDVNLVNEAMADTNFKTIKELVNHLLLELIKFNKRKKLLNLKGKITWEGNLDEMRSNG